MVVGLRRVLVGTAIIAVLAFGGAVVAAIAFQQATDSRQQAEANLRTATAQKLIAQAQGMLSGTQSGGDVGAFQRVLAAHSLTPSAATDGALYTALAGRASALKIITGHTGPVNGVAFSPDGHRLASASADTTVQLWNLDTGQPIGERLTAKTEGMLRVAFSPDGHRLASGSDDGTVRLWPADASPEMLCAKLNANMSHQWRDWVSPDIECITTWSGLPA